MAILVLFNNFMHDFSAAAWVVGALVAWRACRIATRSVESRPLVAPLVEWVLSLMQWSLWGIVVFGVGRVLAYRRYEWAEAAGAGQIPLLVGKHVVFAVVFAVGAVGYLKARRWLDGSNDE